MEIIPFHAPVFGEEVEIVKKSINKIALIDADRYKHVVTYRIWQKIMTEGEVHTRSLVIDTIDDYLQHDIFNQFEAKAYVFCFSTPSGKVFRNAIAQEKKYKGNRKGDDPHFYNDKYDDMAFVYEYISGRYKTLFHEDLEADDILSMLQREETFIFSHDKDLKQVPGWHWDMDKYDLYYIKEEVAFQNLMYQILKGDSTDNFGGLKGFGPKALESFKEKMNVNVTNAEHLFHAVLKLYTDKHGIMHGFDTFVEMWTLASMRLNRGDYNKDKYATSFHYIETLVKELYYGKTDAQSNGDDANSKTLSKTD